MIKTLIVDDEALARRRLRRLLEAERDADVVGEAATGPEAIAAVRELRPDLVFLDVQMPEMDGFAVLQELDAAEVPAVIFVTAFDQYAVRAFEVHALDYLLKPFDAERLRGAFARARRQLNGAAAGAGAGTEDQQQQIMRLLESIAAERREQGHAGARASEKPADRLMIKSSGRVYFVKVGEIDYVEAAGNYVRLHIGKDAHLLRDTMSGVEARLDPSQFLRIHRSTIVNLDRVKEMQPWFSGEYVVIMKDGKQLKLSRGYRDRLDDKLGNSF
ncbi:MAG TPA: LytTR family DNA-binding domain-containing protein [Gemmatimonadaceae bacterium]|nr:LytTR family DNA-binding domain-containing protein [Gemmatimonadaceae bacterium]